jgi:hypothetical protein
MFIEKSPPWRLFVFKGFYLDTKGVRGFIFLDFFNIFT